MEMQRIADQICEEFPTTYVTIETRSYAELLAAVQVLCGPGTVQNCISDTPIYPTEEPEPENPPLQYAAAKAIQVISWGDNGLKAVDKQCYDLVLRMTKSRPGQDDPFVRINLSAIGKRLGCCEKATSKALHGLDDCGLLDLESRRDDVTGHSYIVARAAHPPVWGEKYAENEARAKDARRKRVCQDCGGTTFKLTYVCKTCGVVQDEAPHSEELHDELAEAEVAPVSSTTIPTVDSAVGGANGTTFRHVYRSNKAESESDSSRRGPAVESTVGVLVQETPCTPKIYHIGPRRPKDPWTCACGNRVWESHSDQDGEAVRCDACGEAFAR